LPPFPDKLTRRKSLRVAGLMSGTSADGIDAAIVDIRDNGVKLLAFSTFPYPKNIRRAVFNAFDPETSRVDDICHLNFALGELFASAVIKLADRASIPLSTIHLIGSHGQTIHHLANGRRFGARKIRSTLQVGEPSVIAERTGITTVADFRPRDIAAGGHGAPLVPWADYFLFHHKTKTRAIQNIGGIANVTYLGANRPPGETFAFDTGPGNMMIDRMTVLSSGGKKTYDARGRIAAGGRVKESLLAELLKHPYLRRRPPKTTGREEFGDALSDEIYKRNRRKSISPADIIATVTAFTAHSIADAYKRFMDRIPDEIIICGGGVKNAVLMEMLKAEFPGAVVASMARFGIDPDAKEAISFAILARETILGAPSNVPGATGARHPVILGKIVPR